MVRCGCLAVSTVLVVGDVFTDYDCNQVVPHAGLDWPAWTRVFENSKSASWGDDCAPFLNELMDADAETYAAHRQQCPIGLLNAEIMLYIFARFQGDADGATYYSRVAQAGLASQPLRILSGSRFPIFALLTSEKLRQIPFSAFLNYTETVQSDPLDLPAIPRWDTLDPINAFVTPDTFEGNGWSGDLDKIVIYHFLNGESDTGSSLDPSGTWMKEHGNMLESEVGGVKTKVSLMVLFYTQDDDELYSTAKPGHENAEIRRALLASRKSHRRTDLLGKPCGPMVGGVQQTREPVDAARILKARRANAAHKEL